MFEVVSRSFAQLMAMLFVPLGVLLLMPTVRPLKASWLFFTYLVPIIPLLVLWDGFVSCLRVYSPQELRALVGELPENDYVWDIGTVPLGGPAKATYLVGRPG